MNAIKITRAALGLAAALALAVPAFAADWRPSPVEPNTLTDETRRPELKPDAQQSADINAGVVFEHTQQKTPPDFTPKIGDTLPLAMTIDVMPEWLVRKEPSLAPYGYAKTAKDVLVIDPMDKKIVAILPRPDPDEGKDIAPADWARTRGRELTGQAPEAQDSPSAAPTPAGDSGDKPNGNEKNANQK